MQINECPYNWQLKHCPQYISGNQLLRPILWHLYLTCKPKQVSCVVSGIVNSSATFPVICTSIHPHEWAKRLHHNSNMVCCALQVCLCHGLEVIFYSGPEDSSSYILLKRPTSSPRWASVHIRSDYRQPSCLAQPYVQGAAGPVHHAPVLHSGKHNYRPEWDEK